MQRGGIARAQATDEVRSDAGTGEERVVDADIVESRRRPAVEFVNRGGLVIGIMTASSATGQLLFLPGYAAIDDAFG